MTLRNPDKSPRTFDLDVHAAFELPSGAPEIYAARSRWKAGANDLALRAGQPHTLTLQPFEVLTLEAAPR